MVELETTRPQAPHGTGCHAMCVRPGQEGLGLRPQNILLIRGDNIGKLGRYQETCQRASIGATQLAS